MPLLARGRIGGFVRPHFAHPAGIASRGGHHGESVWHVNAKHRRARWARSLHNVTEVLPEQLVGHRVRRADVHVVLADGACVVLEVQRGLITNGLRLARHRDYAAAGVRDVWCMRSGTRIPHVLVAEGIPVRTLYREGAAGTRLGAAHVRSRQWRTKELRLFELHHPPYAGDPLIDEGFPLSGLGLDAVGVTFPSTSTVHNDSVVCRRSPYDGSLQLGIQRLAGGGSTASAGVPV
ncbi:MULTISPECIES: competence protein CoiA family protein [Actinoalloteichus]|uniref:Uncharacterized protein n=1 Tax=Actinoalloteichus fjordicus TaxID=1612552 RepID=A0AAC9LFC9_9PSEU|nr:MULTISPECIES: competence protein CoiA family protein [Actinoalloteichus]APU15849.1 hypothetical protein UA74_19120 [Actinoalloteichus fjordicus]APU21911.1 hypothetical protein UA75_19610 [Actinoalloteichus sp. GBA129-24]